jgi:hypothetical protein
MKQEPLEYKTGALLLEVASNLKDVDVPYVT